MPRSCRAGRALLRGETLWVNGDGSTSRDFCYIANVVQANLRAALGAPLPEGHQVFNVAVGARTTLVEMAEAMRSALERLLGRPVAPRLEHRAFRDGVVRHSLADISLVQARLGYAPTHDVDQELVQAAVWYLQSSKNIKGHL